MKSLSLDLNNPYIQMPKVAVIGDNEVFDTSALLDTVTGVAGVSDYDPSEDTDPFRIATSRFGSGFIYLFDETGVWNGALSNASILRLWNNGIGKTYPF